MPKPRQATPSFFLTIDTAHPPLSPDTVEETLLDAVSTVRNSQTFRAVKVIHGYGSSGKGGSTREVVRNWAFRQGKRCRAIIEGESYTIFDPMVLEMRKQLGPFEDPDLRNPNPGITVIWVK